MVNNHCPSVIYFNSEQNSTDCKGLWHRRSGIDRLWTCSKEFEYGKQVATTSGTCGVSLKNAFDWLYFRIRIYRNMWQISLIGNFWIIEMIHSSWFSYSHRISRFYECGRQNRWILRHYSVYSYSGIRSIKRALNQALYFAPSGRDKIDFL